MVYQDSQSLAPMAPKGNSKFEILYKYLVWNKKQIKHFQLL